MSDNGRRDDDSRKEPPVVHPWGFDQVSGRGYPGKPKVLLESHLDAQGRKRLFRLTESHGPVESAIVAEEIRDGEPTGWTFKVRFDPEVEKAPYGDLRFRISERLSQRDIVRDPDTGVPAVLDKLIRARLVAPADPTAAAPDVLVDGDRLTWAEFGAALLPYEDWGLRAELMDAGEE